MDNLHGKDNASSKWTKLSLSIDPETPLIYVLRNDFGLKGTKFGYGLEQCGACKVIVDGEVLPSCKRSVASVVGCEITTCD